MTGSDMSKGFCIIGRYVRNGKAPLDTREEGEESRVSKGVPFELVIMELDIHCSRKYFGEMR